jgi:D-amino-acid oxidase
VEPDPVTPCDDILARATALVPELAGAPVLHARVGLRPVRPEVRLERVDRVVHCYGTGGAGITLSWGLAADVTLMAAASTSG